jgi:hypothetical protein
MLVILAQLRKERGGVTVVEAVIEEARQRARRRRGTYGAVVALVTLLGVVLFAVVERTTPSHRASSVLPAPPGLPVQQASLVAHFSAMHVGWVLVYDDGRVIWYDDCGSTSACVSPATPLQWHPHERRLTPAGVQLVRSGAVQPSAFLRDVGWDAPSRRPEPKALWLPESAWAEQESRPYVPSRYAVCYWEKNRLADATSVVSRLPARAAALLRGKERTYHDFDLFHEPPQGTAIECSEVTSEEARALRDAFGAEGIHGSDAGNGYAINFDVPVNRIGEPIEMVGVWLPPILPHGEFVMGTGG